MTSAQDRDGDGRSGPGGLASWQKVVGIVGLAVAAVLLLLLLTGDHGPGRHAPGGEQEQTGSVDDARPHDPTHVDE